MFEAAFSLDDSEDPSRAGTPKPTSEKNEKGKSSSLGAHEAKPAENGASTPDTEKKNGSESSVAGSGKGTTAEGDTPVAELPMDVRVKLRKFERLESTYTG